MLVAFTQIRRSTLEDSLKYLACPADGKGLRLDIANQDQIDEGAFSCTGCGKEYEIRNGVPYFFEKGNGYEWGSESCEPEIVAAIAETLPDRDLTWAKMISLPSILMGGQKGLKQRRQAIDKIFRIATSVIDSALPDRETAAYLMQAATAARYDMEIYRGTFITPPRNMKYLRDNYRRNRGIVAEGACATGENLQALAKALGPGFYLGLDISGNLARQAQQQNSREDLLFVQGNICSLPLKDGSVGIYTLNNVFDRVVNPRQACAEANAAVNPVEGFFVLSNCDPLQYGYTAEDGREVLFVMEENQLSLEKGLKLAGFSPASEERGSGDLAWKISTVAFGTKPEELPWDSLVGRRLSILEIAAMFPRF